MVIALNVMSQIKSRILFLCQYFPPEMGAPSARTFEHTRRWVENGAEVDVVTAVPNHPIGKIYPGYKNKFPYQKEIEDNISVYRCWTFVAANAGKIRRIFNYAFYMIGSILVALQTPKPDVVVATSPQLLCAVAGYAVSRLRRRPFILEIRDLWPESILAVGAMKDGVIIRFLFKVVNFLYKKSAHIVVVTQSFKEILISKGITSEKISVIRNGVDLDFFHPNELKVKKAKNRLKILYIGTLGMAHGLELVLNAAKNLNVEFYLVGEGAEKKKLIKKRDSLGLNNVHIKNFVSREKVPEMISNADLCLVMLKPDKLFETVIPSKMFEMMGMAKPILLGVRGESGEILEKAGAGLSFEPGNLSDFIEKITYFDKNRDELKRMGKRGRIFVVENFDRKRLADEYLSIVHKLVSIKDAVLTNI